MYTGSLTGENACPNCHELAAPLVPDDGRFRQEANRGHILFIITGTVYKIQELEELKAKIDEAIAGGVDSVAFAFEKSSYLSSSMINLMVRTMQSLTIQGKPIYLVTSDTHVLESLQMMDLDRVMKIFPTQEEYRGALAL